MAPAAGALFGFLGGTPVASRDESKDRARLYLGRDVKGKSAAVGENLVTGAESGRRRRVVGGHSIERTGPGRNVDPVGVDEDAWSLRCGERADRCVREDSRSGITRALGISHRRAARSADLANRAAHQRGFFFTLLASRRTARGALLALARLERARLPLVGQTSKEDAMKQLARRALLVVLLLFASRGTASAECAWVLWVFNSPTGLNDPSPSILGSYQAMSGCAQALDGEERTFKTIYSAKWPDVALIPAFRSSNTRMVLPYSLEEKRDKKGYREFLCLPDTVDPRGPKGK